MLDAEGGEDAVVDTEEEEEEYDRRVSPARLSNTRTVARICGSDPRFNAKARRAVSVDDEAL